MRAMLITSVLTIGLVARVTFAEDDSDREEPQGILVVAGGGTTTSEIIEKTLELARGDKSHVVLIAEANRANGPDSFETWKKSDAHKVTLINAEKPASAVASIEKADVIWMPGGLQGVFMNAIRGTGIAEAVRQRYRDGAVIGGTSAGAAVMCKVMIGGRSDLDSLRAGSTPYLMRGLSLWPDVIVDQHFLQKGRFNRLSLAVLDHPDLVGIGIDEETAVIVRGKSMEVIGDNNVTIIDARNARREDLKEGEPAAVRNLKVHILRAGMTFDLEDE